MINRLRVATIELGCLQIPAEGPESGMPPDRWRNTDLRMLDAAIFEIAGEISIHLPIEEDRVSASSQEQKMPRQFGGLTLSRSPEGSDATPTQTEVKIRIDEMLPAHRPQSNPGRPDAMYNDASSNNGIKDLENMA